MRHTLLLCTALLAAAVAVAGASGAARSGNVDMRGVWSSTGQYAQEEDITTMNLATGAFSGHGIAHNNTGYTWPTHGVVHGHTVVSWVFGPYDQVKNYTATCKGTVSADGKKVTGECKDTFGRPYTPGFVLTHSGGPSSGGGGGNGGGNGSKKPTFTAVVCTIVVNGQGSTCTAQVADAGVDRSTPPSGTVTFSASSGTVGTSCTLAGTPGSPGIASCTVSYIPSANLVQGEPPPVSAHYSGDAAFEASSGSSGYRPASVLGPSTITETGDGGIPTDLVNENPFTVSADEQLTVSGTTFSPMRHTQGALAVKVIGRASFRLKPLAAKTATVKLNAAGRALLAKHSSLHALLTVTSRAAGKPTKTTTRRLVLRAR